MLSDLLNVKLSATFEHCDVETAGSSVPRQHAAGTYFVLARDGMASYCDKNDLILGVYCLRSCQDLHSNCYCFLSNT